MPNRESPAETSRRAAVLMRHRAQAAAPQPAVFPHNVCPSCGNSGVETMWVSMGPVDSDSLACRSCGHRWAGPVGGPAYGAGWSVAQGEQAHAHVASWRPTVALAAADLVECPCDDHAQKLAHAYLGDAHA